MKEDFSRQIRNIEKIIESIKTKGCTYGRFKGIARIALSSMRAIERSHKSKEKA